jgi:hypothetical protein
MPKLIRRVVTGHDAVGRSVFLQDGAPPPRGSGRSGVTVTDLWKTHATPASNAGAAEAIGDDFALYPPAGGSVFRIIEYPPDHIRLQTLDPARHYAEMGAPDAADRGTPRHPGFHKTDTIDYCIVLAGEIWALMDEGEVRLEAGDVLVQRGTNHAWSNRTEVPALVAFVLIPAAPA